MENMTNSLSAGDIMALTRDNGFLEGNGIIILILFFLMFGNGGFGNRGYGVTQAELQAGLYNQTSDANLRDIRNAISDTNGAISTTNYNSLSQFKDLSSQLASCCCENRLAIANQTNQLSAQMTANTQAILDKMCQSEIQNLRDEVAGYRETLSNANQTQNILSTIGRFYINNPIGYYTNGYYPYGTQIQ